MPLPPYFKKILYIIIILVILILPVVVYDHYTIEKNKNVTVVALGDIMLGRHVGELIATGVDPFQYTRFDASHFPEKLLHDGLTPSNIVMANLEGPITTATDCQDKAYSFKFATTTALLLKLRGITAVSDANNHSQDCYNQGFIDTQKYLGAAGVDYFGGFALKDIASEIVVHGVHVALVGLDMTVSPPPSKAVYDLISTLKTRNTFVIVNIHWGTEYSLSAIPAQTEVAHKLIDAGVDLIIGNHPHVVEPVEVYKGKHIFYSLGNFIFDQTDPETKKGLLVYAILSSDGMQDVKTYMYHINHSQPQLDK
jgi:poly-gamma-glutamate synthesis protein (capsule biosynthesis protein)